MHKEKHALILVKNQFLKAFLTGLLLACVVFIPFIIFDNGYFIFYGDFNVQQIPFYQVAHDAVRSGNLGWNHMTDLGVSFIGAYSFYLLGSPFFWLTIPFSNDMLPHLMGPLLILKFACATLTSYIFLRRYVKNQDYAILGAVMYAFSGFSVYNIFFNHFHEAIVVFPLMLAALDEYMYHRRRGVFALSVMLCCVVNYYFFVGQVTFTLLYFFLRLACKSWKISLKDFLLVGLEAVLGVGMACFLMIPSVLAVLQNNRTDNYINGWNAVLYNKNQRYLHILQSLFFPPDLPARPNFTPDSESKWASLGAWLPLFSMTGVIGWLQIRKKHWLKKFLWILFLMMLVPGLNAMFQLMNSSFYGRWYYMLTLMLSLATIMALEYTPVNWKRSITWTTVITVSMAAVIGFVPKKVTQENGEETLKFGLMEYRTRFWSYVAIALICLALLVYLFQFNRRNHKRFMRNVRIILYSVAVMYSVFFIALGKTQSLSPKEHIIPYALNGGENLTIADVREDSVRTDFYESMDNSAMFWKVQSIQAFHSIVPGSVMDFYDAIGVQRDVASRPDTTHFALRGLTSVKWLFDDDHDDKALNGDGENDGPMMPGWLYHGNENGFDVWENQYYIPMGFCYDYYVTASDFEKVSEADRDKLMLKALVVEDDRIADYYPMLMELPASERIYTEESYYEDCLNRRDSAAQSFAYTREGFIAEINSSKDNVLFFSVPYEDGWTAYVNGEEAAVQRVNVGFMAVRIPQGEKVIVEFRYRTPGLLTGSLMSVAAVALFIVYMVVTHKFVRKRERNRPESDDRLKLARFSAYAEKKNVSFRRPGAMVPKENMIPEPPDHIPDARYALKSEELKHADDNSEKERS